MTEVTLLDTLTTEVTNLIGSGKQDLAQLWTDSEDFLTSLHDIEASLEAEIENESHEGEADSIPIIADSAETSKHSNASKTGGIPALDKLTKNWYKTSIDSLKSYNSSINKFNKNILTSSKFYIDLDDAYTYPLNLNNFPVSIERSSQKMMQDPSGIVTSYDTPDISDKDTPELTESRIFRTKVENRETLLKAIILHLLKIGQCDIVPDFVSELAPDTNITIDEALLNKFERLKKIVDDIVINHNLTPALDWFKDKYNDDISKYSSISKIAVPYHSNYNEIEFKFHMLQFILLLNGKGGNFCIDNALKAYLYSKENFSRFFKDYVNEISPLMTLLLFETDKNDIEDESSDIFGKKHFKSLIAEFVEKLKQSYNLEKSSKNSNQGESKFVYELLNCFENIHDSQSLFVNLSNEFISEYCKDLKLSNDSSLFQSVLAGLVYLPSFYKYKKIQMKMGKVKVAEDNLNGAEFSKPDSFGVAPYSFDLPFQLPDSCRFLFNYHPIFICPVSKDQLIPELENEDDNKILKKRKSSLDPSSAPSGSPVVVLNFCNHVALRESMWQLSKKGNEIFKCHYCYKKHEYSNLSDAYFIDL